MISEAQFNKEIELIIANAIREDVGDGDHSSLACIPQSTQGKAKLLVKDEGNQLLHFIQNGEFGSHPIVYQLEFLVDLSLLSLGTPDHSPFRTISRTLFTRGIFEVLIKAPDQELKKHCPGLFALPIRL